VHPGTYGHVLRRETIPPLRYHYCSTQRFLTFRALIHFWTIKSFYHVRVRLLFFHLGIPSTNSDSFFFPTGYSSCQDSKFALTVVIRYCMVVREGKFGLLEYPDQQMAEVIV